MGEAATLADRLRGPRSRPKAGWDSLTATEALVVDLAALGRTNPEIAAKLLVSKETVKTHLSSIFRKLDLTNRVELAKAVAERA